MCVAVCEDKLKPKSKSSLNLIRGLLLMLLSSYPFLCVGAVPWNVLNSEEDADFDAAVEIARPRCGTWGKSLHVSGNASSSALISDTRANIMISPSYLDGYGWVTVFWAGLPPHADPFAIWIGIYLEAENATTVAPIK